MMLYDQLLHAVENRLQSAGTDAAHELLRSAYNSVCPQPNHELNVRTAVRAYLTLSSSLLSPLSLPITVEECGMKQLNFSDIVIYCMFASHFATAVYASLHVVWVYITLSTVDQLSLAWPRNCVMLAAFLTIKWVQSCFYNARKNCTTNACI